MSFAEDDSAGAMAGQPGECTMLMERTAKNGFELIRMMQDVTINVDIGGLVGEVRNALAEGGQDIAIAFTPLSFLSTRSISVLVQCYEMVTDHGGALEIVTPNRDMLGVLETIGLECQIRVHETEEGIGC
ncbi:MAG: STAS domain-containing protein [Chitinivibrionales bacterium]|nr:STAS domain-containing protein [Chitinivibrionales bacterium]MBD3395982.1 STAS domain-containing protein [Chitinivibrionales bacterium]